MCFGLSCGFGESDLGDIELGECSGELARGGDPTTIATTGSG